VGRYYPHSEGRKFFKPVLELPTHKHKQLSFINLVEAHVLDAIRRRYNVPLFKVRAAITYLQRHFHSRHPLADHRLETDGAHLFVQRLGNLINVTQEGQLAMRALIEAHLQRIEWGREGVAQRLYPFVLKRSEAEPKVVMIDPRVSFGRPVIIGTGIPTVVIAERFRAGESPSSLAADYGRSEQEILNAIRCELREEAA
jgi:uncharacterized protein (DUF433 family)